MTLLPDPDLPPVEQLRHIMRVLRDKTYGCPWDVQQDFSTIAPYTIEEAYEVADAINRKNKKDLCEELGDLLLQTVFHAQMAEEEGSFTFDDVARTIVQKMIIRHPHVFGQAETRDAEAQTEAWEQQKAEERKKAGYGSVLDNIPRNLPALMRAEKIQKRAASIGFDWQDEKDVFAKIIEEVHELQEAVASGNTRHIAEEWGDLVFVMVNLARRQQIRSDAALQAANAKFEQRFRAMEAMAEAEGNVIADETLEEMEARWQRVKSQE